MPNPYKYTLAEVDQLVKQWENDNYMVYDLKDFIMYETRFTEQEFEEYRRSRRIPHGL